MLRGSNETRDRDTMNETNIERPQVPPGEPKLILPFLAPFYAVARDLSYPLMRITLGGLMLFHAFTSGKLLWMFGPNPQVSTKTTSSKYGVQARNVSPAVCTLPLVLGALMSPSPENT